MDRERENETNQTHCLACGYDVVGLGDEGERGVCPECGGKFDLKEIRLRAERIRKSSISSGTACVIIGVTACVMCPPALFVQSRWQRLDGGSEFLLVIFLVCMLAIWMAQPGGKLWRAPRTFMLPLVGFLAFRIAFGVREGGDRHVHLGLALLCGALLSHIAAWLAYSRDVGLLAVLVGLYLLVPGAFMALTIPETLGATHWSGWPDPRSGQVYRQYPLTQVEVGRVATALVTTGGLLVSGGYWWHLRRPKARDPEACEDAAPRATLVRPDGRDRGES